MLRIFLQVLIGLIVLGIVILGILLVWPMYEPDPDYNIELIPAERMPELGPNSSYVARDGTELPLRVYPSPESDIAFILLHGGGGYGAYMHEIASTLSVKSIASVYVPDLRGHGESPGMCGDIVYVDQLEDDLADLIDNVRIQNPQVKIVVGGHSGGGGLVLRLAVGEQDEVVDGYLLLAPFLGLEAPTTRENAGGYVHLRMPRIIALDLLNSIGVTVLDGLEAVYLNRPINYRTDYHTTTLSWRMVKGFGTPDYEKDLAKIEKPMLFVVGEQDEAFDAGEYLPVIDEFASHADVVIKPGSNHVEDILWGDNAIQTYSNWLQNL